jgi:hypothetical protein
LTTSPVGSCTYVIGGSFNANTMIIAVRNYVTWDNLEEMGHCFGGNFSAPNSSNSMINVGGTAGVILSNNYWHGWTHVTFACGPSPYTTGTCDTGTVANSLGASSLTMASNVCDGGDSDGTSDACFHGVTYDVHYNVFRYNTNGSTGQSHLLYDNLFEYFYESSAGACCHSNVFEENSSYVGDNLIYNNLIRHNRTAVTLWTCPATGHTDYYFNNVEEDSQQEPWNFQTTCGTTGNAKFWNNTFANGGGPIGGAGSWNGDLQNNHYINQPITGGGYGTPNSNLNAITWTNADAAKAGFTLANNYAPPNSNCGGFSPCPIGAGANLSSYCAKNAGPVPNDLCSSTTLGVSYDAVNHVAVYPARTPNPRPSSGAWDVGAYQYQSGSATGPASPTGLSAVVN